MDENRHPRRKGGHPGADENAQCDARDDVTPPAAISHGSIRRAARDDEIAIEHISEGSSRYSDDVATRTNTRADEMGMNEKVEGVSTVTNAPLSLTSEEVADFQPNPDGDVQHGPFRKKWEKIRGWKYWRGVLHLGLWVLLTSWWIAGLALHGADKNWLVPFLIWLLLSLRLVTLHVSTKYIVQPVARVFRYVSEALDAAVGGLARTLLLVALVVLVIIVVTYATPQTADNTYADRTLSMTGLAVTVLVFWATSRHRKHVNWRTVLVGILVQFLVGVFVMRSESGRGAVEFAAWLCKTFLGYSKDGTKLLLSGSDELVDNSTWFFLHVVPAVIWYVGMVQMFSYWGWTQWLVGKAAAFFFLTMRVSGAEAVVAAASPFVGAGESSVLIRPFLAHLTRAEIHQVMTSGFSTVAGSVLFAYISMGVSGNVVISSCVMSIPASLVVSKLRYPETEETLTGDKVQVPELDEADAETPQNSLQALADGTWLGLKVAAMICGVVLVLISLVAMLDAILGWMGSYVNAPHLNLAGILGYPLYPVALLCGVSREGQNVFKVAELLGIKIVANEVKAFLGLVSEEYVSVLSPRSRLIAMYALCGFGNVGSVGIQIGVLAQLAPACRSRVATQAASALISGIFATLTSACVAGMLITDASAFLASTAT